MLNHSYTSFAQDNRKVVFGIKAGMDVSTFSGFKHNDYAKSTSAKIGFTGGITVDVNLPHNLIILSGLEYVQKGMNLETTDAILITKPYYKAQYIQLPIHLGYKIKTEEKSNLIFHLGPYFAYGVGGEIKWRDKNFKMDSKMDFFDKDLFNRFDYGLGIGVNIDTKNFALNIGYDYGLSNIAKSSFYFPDRTNIDAKGISVHTRNLHITLGYKFRLGY